MEVQQSTHTDILPSSFSVDNTKEKITPLSRGGDFLLAGLQQHKHLIGASSYSSIRKLLTLGERIPYEQALESLTPFEQRIMEYTQGHPDLTLTYVESLEALPDNSCLVVQERRVGHVSILLTDEINSYQLAKPRFIAGAIQFPTKDYADLEIYKRECDQQLIKQAQQAAIALQVMTQEGQLQSLISNIRENLMRIGPTFIHVGHRVYSTFDRVGKNLLDTIPGDENYLLTLLTHQPVNSWFAEDQIYIYGTYLLLISGGPARMEEFNGGQLTPDILDRFFDNKAQFYADNLGETIPANWTNLQPLEKAQWLRQKMDEVNSRSQRYRVINGLNIRQEERILGLRNYSLNRQLEMDLTDRISRIFGIEKIGEESDREYWKRVTEEVILAEQAFHLAKGDKTNEVSPLPLLLWSTISSAVEATSSDFGMSSTFRDIQKLRKLGPLSLKKEDFYCCVVPSQRIIGTKNREEIAEDQQLMANRMEFNRWHFVPASLNREEIPFKRHWLYAPAIPDITTETDWHHGGHVDAKIHHSLRHPAPISVAGHEYRGSYDIRLVRQNGEPYKPEDIKTARVYLNALGSILGTLIEYVETTDRAVRIEGFTTRWYRDGVWIKYQEMVAA